MLYSVALLVQYGSATAAAAVWDSGTFSNMMGRTNGQAQPFRLIMQSVRPCTPQRSATNNPLSLSQPPFVSHACVATMPTHAGRERGQPGCCPASGLQPGHVRRQGTEFKDAIYYSATYGQGTPPCALTVSGSGGGFISVSDSTYTALYVQPPTFQVRLALTS